MADWGKLELSRVKEDDSTSQAPPNIPEAAANTKASYATMFASCPFLTAEMLAAIQIVVGTDYLMDVAVGAAASEVVVVPNIPMCNTVGTAGAGDPHGMVEIAFPVSIRPGVRIAARQQNTTGASGFTSLKMHVIAEAFAGLRAPSRWKDWGTVLASSRGTSVVAGAAGVKGSWTQLTASMDFTTRWIIVAISQDAGIAVDNFKLDVGVGGAGSEVAVIPNYSTTMEHHMSFMLLPLRLVAGQRLSARVSGGSASTTVYVSVLGGA